MNKIRFGVTNALDVSVTGQTVGQVLGNTNYRSALGFGSNVSAKINGSPVSDSYVIREGDVIDIENKAQQKAADATVTVKFGATAQLTRAVPSHTTIRALLTDRSIRAALGFGDNAIAKINGATVRDDLFVSDGMRIDIETRAQEKAA